MEKLIQKTTRTLVQVGEALGIHNLDPEAGKIFITGGTGVIGHRVASRLLNAGYPQIRLGGNPEHLDEENKLGAEIADFHWEQEETYKTALEGVTSVLVTIPYTRNWHQHFEAFLKACTEAGVKHVVKLSFYHARVPGDRFQDVALVREHGHCDTLLIKTAKPESKPGASIAPIMGPDMADLGLDISRPNFSYTILYASHFMSNPFTFYGHELRREDVKPAVFYGAHADRGVNYVSPNDVAEVAVRVLVAPRDHYNKEYTLTGPTHIKDQAVAELIGKYLSKPVMYVDQPLHEFASELKMGGDPKWMVDDLIALEKIKSTAIEEMPTFPTDDIEKICGHPAETFEEYLQRTDTMTRVEAGPPGPLAPLKETMSA
jgi:uncharacterized protein YbjT (DUF2867 family)